MVIIRCTRELLDRLKHTVVEPDGGSTTRLGDWYVSLVRVGRRQFLLAISEKTRLPVVLPARDLQQLPAALHEAVGRILRAIGVPDGAVDTERAEMAASAVAPTRSRSLLGTSRDFTFAVRGHLQDEPDVQVDDVAVALAETPILKPFGGASPRDETRRAFGLEAERPATRTRRHRAAARLYAPISIDGAVFETLRGLNRHERIGGMVYPSPPPSPAHQFAVMRIAQALDSYFQTADPAQLVLTGPVDVFLDHDDIVQPDAIVARRAQVSERGIEGPPTIIVEVASPENLLVDCTVKAECYDANGVDRYWIVDPQERTVHCFGRDRTGGHPPASSAAGVLTLPDMPGFRLELASLWL